MRERLNLFGIVLVASFDGKGFRKLDVVCSRVPNAERIRSTPEYW